MSILYKNGRVVHVPVEELGAANHDLVAASAGERVVLLSYSLICQNAAAWEWQDTDGTVLSGVFVAAGTTSSREFHPAGHVVSAAGQGLRLNLSVAGTLTGRIVVQMIPA